MALTGLHTNWKYGSYEKDRNEEIMLSENDRLKGGDLSWLKYYDGKANSIAIGYGFDLLVRDNAEINSYLTAIGLGALSPYRKMGTFYFSKIAPTVVRAAVGPPRAPRLMGSCK